MKQQSIQRYFINVQKPLFRPEKRFAIKWHQATLDRRFQLYRKNLMQHMQNWDWAALGRRQILPVRRRLQIRLEPLFNDAVRASNDAVPASSAINDNDNDNDFPLTRSLFASEMQQTQQSSAAASADDNQEPDDV